MSEIIVLKDLPHQQMKGIPIGKEGEIESQAPIELKDRSNCSEDTADPLGDLTIKDQKFTAKQDLTNESNFYLKAKDYWSNQPATVNGMLGGFELISPIDIKGSRIFLLDVLKNCNKNWCLDCGAGIGRVSKNLLMPMFSKCDMVEQDEKFCEKARKEFKNQEKIGNIFNIGLQKFVPETRKYDLIFSQWVLGHLTDEDLLGFFKRLHNGLNKNGIFVIKENVTSSDKLELDETDSSCTRALETYKRILINANFKIVKSIRQKDFPKGLYPVYMIACIPLK